LQTICFYKVTAKLGNFRLMEHTSEQQRIAFSKRLTQELRRIGQPIGSPTQIARTFNQNYSGKPVSAQTVRKWLLSEGLPTQAKLQALAAWLGVSAQWLRYGSGRKVESTAPLSEQQTGLVMLGKEYAGIIPIVDKLVRLSPRDIRIVESIVQTMHMENNKK
jgi:transcriptional regulator with XRE-family HTH domain